MQRRCLVGDLDGDGGEGVHGEQREVQSVGQRFGGHQADAQADAWLDESRVKSDPKERKAIYEKLAQKLLSEGGIQYLYHRKILIAHSNKVEGYKQMIVDTSAADVVYTPFFTGVHGNYLKPSVARAGLDPDNLPAADKTKMNFGSGAAPKAWKDIWGAGQGVGNIQEVLSTRELAQRLLREYHDARARLSLEPAA